MNTWIQKLPFLALVLLCTPPALAQNNTSPDVVYLSQQESIFYQTLNRFRGLLNLPQLQIHTSLEASSQKYSAWLDSTDFLTHYGPAQNETPFTRMEQEGYTNFTYAGENIACGFGDAISTFRQFAFSPEHLENMMSPHFYHMGISRAGSGNEHCPFYWVNDFGSITDMNLDQGNVTDLNLIGQAIAAVSGPINGQVVALPPPDFTDPSTGKAPLPIAPIQGDPNQSVPTPLPESTPQPTPLATPTPTPYGTFAPVQSATPTPTPASVPDSSNVVATPPSESNFSVIQCTVPYRFGQGLFAFSPNVDTVLNILNVGTTYNIQATYFQNGSLANITPTTIYGVDVVKAKNYPLYDIFAAPGPRINGFIIEFDAQNGTAQFTPYLNNGAGSAGAIDCSIKF